MRPTTAGAPAFSIVVPMPNEAEHVEQLLGEIGAALAGDAHEIVVVDDGSNDGTLNELTRVAARMPSCVWCGTRAKRPEHGRI